MSMNEKIPGWGIVLILVFCIGAGWVVFNKFASSGVNITIAVIISIIVAIAIYEQIVIVYLRKVAVCLEFKILEE